MPHSATEVFTPAGVPTLTYVYRSDNDLETQFRLAMKTPGLIVSLSGPSKSGKTVLVNKVIEKDNLIIISGGAISSPELLWDRILNWMDSPSEVAGKSATTTSGDLSARAGGKLKVPLVAEGSADTTVRGGVSRVTETSEKRLRTGIDQVISEIANSEYVVFIDDFHYMPRDVQEGVARQIKEAAERGVRICTASVPHRSDDVVRGNTELRGRVHAINFSYWDRSEMKKIADQGFAALNAAIDDSIIEKFIDEAFGSPQLMQAICLQACFQTGLDVEKRERIALTIEDGVLKRILEHTSSITDFSSLLEAMHSGPKSRGRDRGTFSFQDGSRGDVYRCILLAISRSPPKLSLNYDEIYTRTRAVCDSIAPTGSSVTSAIDQMVEIAETRQPGSKVIEYSDDVLNISDPYFLYYLRCSARLRQIQRADQ